MRIAPVADKYQRQLNPPKLRIFEETLCFPINAFLIHIEIMGILPFFGVFLP